MENVNVKSLIFAAVAGALLGGAGTAGVKDLIQDAPGGKTYFVHALDVKQQPADDGGVDIVATGYITATVTLRDGGSSQTDLGPTPCSFTRAQETALKMVTAACAP